MLACEPLLSTATCVLALKPPRNAERMGLAAGLFASQSRLSEKKNVLKSAQYDALTCAASIDFVNEANRVRASMRSSTNDEPTRTASVRA
eukprot:6214443-Pleurochrysis_carterae.AAC.2